MIPARRVVTDPDDVRVPGQILIRSHNSEWAALEDDCNALLIDPDLNDDTLITLHQMGL